MTITRATVLATAAVLLASTGTVSAAKAPQHSKAQQQQHRHQAAKEVSTPTKGAVQYGNNTQDNSHGGVYGENSFKGE
jgi:hypothetical protein